MTTISVGFKTDVGKRRSNNEDSYCVLRGADLHNRLDGLYVVADGMGGGRAGDVASRIVAQVVPDAVQEALMERNGFGLEGPAVLLRGAVERANQAVWSRQVEQTELAGMGTTCVAALLSNGEITIANIGDSRAYLLRDGRLSQITQDHSEVWQQVLAGNLTRDQARRSKYRNAITRAVGLSASVTADIDTISLQEGDT
ncbi:MAG TPA: protein phosphatase 2C domain-containing protein, partial [Chthonomonadales bacterium]|nr:protein phosphatase 2C domain-containing protein [Chthonomonadales bacterium]